MGIRPLKNHIAMLVCSLLAQPTFAQPADTGKLPCGTTAECNQQAAKVGATVAPSAAKDNTTSATDQAEDQFFWVNKINKASAVMLTEEKILTPEMGQKIAKGASHAIAQAKQPGGKRPADVLQIEAIISEAIGADASLIHTGRSRQDMYATFRMAKLRIQLLDYADALNSLRERMLATAAQNINTIVPAYTNGVQAMPISYAHYLLAYDASFERDAQRVREVYKRLNRSAMGTEVLANSSWPLNRKRMAELLGFDDIIENSLDASQVSPSDIALEAIGIPASTSIRLGAMLGDIHTQYHQVRPWLLLDEGSTYTSSAMPQKRNPGLIMRAREAASNVVGLAQTVIFRAHNVTTGMTDYKTPSSEIGFFPQAVKMIAGMNAVMDALTINPKRSLEELEDDWTASVELAETLQRQHRVPFRVGHGFASSIVTFARANGIKPKDFPYSKAVELYAQTITKFKLPEPKLPLSEAVFRQALSPEHMVNTRVGIGGPQPAEVTRMLASAQTKLLADKGWVRKTRQNLTDADVKLDKAFNQLLGEGSK